MQGKKPYPEVHGVHVEKEPPNVYMHPDEHHGVHVEEDRHELAIKKGRLLASVHNECQAKYQASAEIAEAVLLKATQHAEQSEGDVEVIRRQIASASAADKMKDPHTLESTVTKWGKKLDTAEAAHSFYVQIVDNAKIVLEHTSKGLKNSHALKDDVVGGAVKYDQLEGRLIVQAHDAQIVDEEKTMLWKQWKASSQDFDCVAPPSVEHAQALCTGGNTEYSPECLMKCSPGYDDPDASKNTLRCHRQGKFGTEVYGEWKGLAMCVGRMCGQPSAISKAKTMGQPIRFPHAATYNCYEGYSQDGSAKGQKVFGVPCSQAGNFKQNSSHSCQRVKCGAAPVVKGAEPIMGTFFFADTVTFKCKLGYTLDGTPGGLTNFSTSCEATGRFSQAQQCKLIRCGPPPEYEKTDLLSAKGEKYYGDELSYKCHQGYSSNQEASGLKQFTLRCDGGGRFAWKGGAADAPVPQCRAVSAGMLPAVEHGNAKSREMFYGEEIIITADAGYSIAGKPTSGLSFLVSATPEGTFAGLAKFLPVKCGAAPVVEKAKNAATIGVYGDIINYACEDGFSTDKSDAGAATNFSIQCEADGDYSAIPNLGYCANIDDCAEHTCGPHGACVDSLKNYSCDCDSGYAQSWNNETSEFICGNINDCGPEACGVGKCQDQVNGYKCICPNGYEEDGEDDEKTCRAKVCGQPPQVENAATSPKEDAAQKVSYQDVPTMYQCDAGHTLNGSATGKNHFSISCLADTTFTSTQSCIPIECGEAPEVEHAAAMSAQATFNQTTTYNCEAGYTIDGTPSGDGSFGINCLVSGQYGDASKCRPVNCGEPDEVSNSHRPDGALVYLESVTYTCFEGFSLDSLPAGPTEFKVGCHRDGSLDKLSSCLPKVCGEPPKRINALFAMAPDEGSVAYPRITEVGCRDGYTVDGSPGGNTSFIVACTAAGKFEPYEKGECEPVRCGLVPVMPNATLDRVQSPHQLVDRKHLNYEEEAFFQCLPGFSTGGEPSAPKTFVVQCLPSGEFSSPTADMQCRDVNDCERYTCGPKGTCIDLVGPSPAYTCACEHGFEMQTKTNGEKTCGNTDDCKDMDCGVGVCKDLIGDYTCTCPSGHYIGEKDGAKTCLPVMCVEHVPFLSNGRMLSTHSGAVSFPTTLRYKCDTGYSTDGSVADAKREFQAQCKPNGQLDGMTSCQPITCGSPRVLPFTILVQPESPRKSIEYGEVVKYTCLDGHTIRGIPDGVAEFTVDCPDNGVLTDPAVCEPVKCGQAPRISKGRAAISGDVFYGMHLKYICDTGHTVDGSPQGSTEFQRHCLRNGLFSDLLSNHVCKPIYGGKAPALAGAVMTEYGGHPVNTFPPALYYPAGLEYKCNIGYSENGSPSGAVKISARVNSLGKLSPALPSGCLPITYAIRGQVKDARNGRNLDGVVVHAEGTNQTSRTSGGFFALMGTRPGNVKLIYKKEGFIDAMKILSVNADVNTGGAADVAMSPKMAADQWRAVLKWGARPADLDTYYVDGRRGGPPVYWQRKRRRVGRMMGVLENDVASGYGPETMFLSGVGKCTGGQKRCDIRYFITDYGRGGNMKDISGAQVTLYNGDKTAGTWTIKGCQTGPPNVSPNGNWWHVFTIDGKRNRIKWNCKEGRVRKK